MQKQPRPSKLRIRRETLASLASSSVKRVAGGYTLFANCTEFCTYEMACQTITCPSVDAECIGTVEASCRC